MRLTLYTDYSLRVLMYLGQKGDQLATISEIATYYGVSRNHLMKVVHQLGTLGFVETLRGKGGGIRLGRPADEIGLGDVVRHTEETLELVDCSAGEKGCVIEPACQLRLALNEAMGSFMATLDLYTLADLLNTGIQPGLPSIRALQ
jgi:Rrf2 family nitric oxide-sensitive transcriptional repressor